jgi:putative transcriptional regulator
MESLKGKLLIASPSLPDPNFSRTVVLMIQHDKDGAFGIVLNRPSGKMVEEIWDHVSDQPCNKNRPINVGGPVAGPLIAVHTEPALGDLELGSGIYFSTDKTKLEQLLLAADLEEDPHLPLRLYIGYAGWGGGQLEEELETGSWLSLTAQRDYIFYDETDLWQITSREVGKQILGSALKIDRFPDDPSVN